jgi:hypothetical protein
VVRGNRLTVYQISEPLQSSSSASASNPAPFGTDVNGTPLNDPIPDTLVDPATGDVVSAAAAGQSALLDKFTVTKPDVEDSIGVHIEGPQQAVAGSAITYNVRVRNGSAYPLNGAQVVIHLPDGAAFAGATNDTLTVHGGQVVVTVGRIGIGGVQTVEVSATLASSLWSKDDAPRERGAAVEHGSAGIVKRSTHADRAVTPNRGILFRSGRASSASGAPAPL